MTPYFQKLNQSPGKVSIRWRKNSATWVIYLAGKIVESGFNSENDAENFLEEKLPELYNRYYLSKFD